MRGRSELVRLVVLVAELMHDSLRMGLRLVVCGCDHGNKELRRDEVETRRD